MTSFIGREREIAEATRLLSTTRLLTLTGTGGVGKSRLGRELAASQLGKLPDGVWLVELAALADGTLVPRAVATVLGVPEEAGRSPTAKLADALRAQQLLLVLDNCEHLIEACAEIVDALLRACPGLRILATSRQALRTAGETTFRVPSLSLSARRVATTLSVASADRTLELVAVPPLASGRTEPSSVSEAVRLFVERAQAAVSWFALTDANASAVQRICERLDGIPLAIELAASRVAVLTPEQIAARLGDRFGLLSGGSRTALPRYQTLRALIDWSHDLLDDGERLLFCRLGVFAGGWTLETAESVCSVDGLEPAEILNLLSGLVAKSLVVTVEHGDEVRYRFLETLREYAAEKLRETGDGPILRRRHLDWFLALAERAEPELSGPRQAAWLQRLDDEHDNLRAALAWSSECEGTERPVRLAGALHRFWATRGFVTEGRRWLGEVLARSDALPATVPAAQARVKALQAAGRLANNQGDHSVAQQVLAEALAIARGHDDRPGLAAGAAGFGCLARMRGDNAAAHTLLTDALGLFRELGDAAGAADTLVCLGVVARAQDDPAGARALYEESLAAYRALGNRQGVALSLNCLGDVILEQGDLATARRLEEESLILASEVGDRERVAYALAVLGGVAAAQGESERALRLGAAAMSIREAIGGAPSAAWRARFERWMEPARRALTDGAVATAWAAGEAISEKQAIEYALRPVSSAEPMDTTSEGLSPTEQPAPLTHRESELAALVARGLTNRQIATEMVITEGTAANYVQRVLTKLDFNTRSQIASWVVERSPAPSSRRS